MKVPPVLPGLVCATSLLLVFPLEQAGAKPRPWRDSHAYSRPATSLSPEFDPDLARDSRFRSFFLRAPILESQDDQVGVLPLPSPTPLPSASALPSPTVVPTPPILPTTTPAPSSSPTVTPSPPGSPPAPPVLPSPPPPPPVPPPPNPVASVPLPSAPPLASVGPPLSATEIQRLTPIVEIWRAGASTPQVPIRHGRYLERAFVAGTDSVMIQLQFDPLIAGKIVTVAASPGVIFEPLQTAITVQPTGACAVTVRLGDGFSHGHLSFSCQGRQTILPLQRSSDSVVAAKEMGMRR